ncbi:MAG: hypothetical protein K8U57_39420 [Planctomycetes bacterium]|nr:hypothetical protein [Planctomycetota bacterium]
MKWTLTLIVGLLAVGDVRADVAALPGTKMVHAVHRIETEQEFPESVFLLVREGWRYNPAKKESKYVREPEFVELSPNKPFIFRLPGPLPGIEAESREEAYLFVVKRSEIKPGMSPQEVLNLGAHQLEWFDYRTTLPSWSRDKERALTYRVQRDQSAAGFEIVQIGQNPMRQWEIAVGAVCLFVTLAVVIGGLLLVRAILQAPPPPKYSPPPG